MYKGKTFVVKAGGAVFGDAVATRALIEQIAILHYLGIKVVMVHGGGPQLTQVTEAMGVPTRMVQGRRITDEKAIDATSMVLNGLINTKLLAFCRELEIEAVGVSGVDAGLIKAHTRGPVQVEGEMVDYGFVGDIDLVDDTVLKKLLDNGLMPVVSPLSADDKGTLLNINADTVAAAIGAALGAEKLILCTGAPGILANVADPRSVISYTDLEGLEKLRAERRHQGRHAAQGQGHRGSDPGRRAPRARDLLRRAGQHPHRGVHQRRPGHADRRRHRRAVARRAAGRQVG